jgi:putative tryptophan/tyrosine transport system substrate-binding protein
MAQATRLCTDASLSISTIISRGTKPAEIPVEQPTKFDLVVNLIAVALYEPSMGGKWLELLKQIAPGVTRVPLLFNPATTVPVKFYMSSIEAAASSFAIQTSTAPVHAKDEIEGVIAALAGNSGAGLIVMPDLFNTINRDLIIALAARYRVPAIYAVRSFADSGGLKRFDGLVRGQRRALRAWISQERQAYRADC